MDKDVISSVKVIDITDRRLDATTRELFGVVAENQEWDDGFFPIHAFEFFTYYDREQMEVLWRISCKYNEQLPKSLDEAVDHLIRVLDDAGVEENEDLLLAVYY